MKKGMAEPKSTQIDDRLTPTMTDFASEIQGRRTWSSKETGREENVRILAASQTDLCHHLTAGNATPEMRNGDARARILAIEHPWALNVLQSTQHRQLPTHHNLIRRMRRSHTNLLIGLVQCTSNNSNIPNSILSSHTTHHLSSSKGRVLLHVGRSRRRRRQLPMDKDRRPTNGTGWKTQPLTSEISLPFTTLTATRGASLLCRRQFKAPSLSNKVQLANPASKASSAGCSRVSEVASVDSFAHAAMGKRDEDLEAGPEPNKLKNRRRKLKDEQDDDGRSTPSKVKRTKHPLPSEPMARTRLDSPPIQERPAPQPKPKPVPLPPKPKTIISSSAVMETASKYPRHHLGDFIYEAGLKASRLVPNNPNHRGFSSNPKPLPWDVIQGKINCTLTVKVPQIHLSSMSREEITARSYLWGTDVYTDDSDVVAACIHSGWIKGEWSEPVDTEMLDADANEGKRRKKALPLEPIIHEGLITSTPSPMPVPEDRDLHVNVLILPRLVKYGSTTRHGITSREFGGEFGARHAVHDGLSYTIQSLRWVENGAQPQARLRGKARRERMRKAMMEVQGTLANNLSGADRTPEKDRGEITGSWWKKDTEKNGTAGGEGDKENQAAGKQGGKDSELKDVEMEGTAAASDEAKKRE
ncbi:hypothetical protein NLU13_8376 [Sarocladium strictum]|uniref:Uncharacterized protein n=1 Tax=Sarocladium strictum TaxID=5046 RepID=A0AA39L4X5_SARSR|nr:hypothetical protein NLU13_8376 [Sarocladium strictum]